MRAQDPADRTSAASASPSPQRSPRKGSGSIRRVTRLLSGPLLVASSVLPGTDGNLSAADRTVKPVAWTRSGQSEVAELNRDMVAGKPTMDVAVYLPSNLDPAYTRVTLPLLVDGLKAAKEIYGRAGVQINVLWVKTGAVDRRFLAIQASEIPQLPDTEYLNLYEAGARAPSQPTAAALGAFNSIVQPSKDGHRTIHLVVLQDVVFPIIEYAEGRHWRYKVVRTGGLSFPTYAYHRTLPASLRGVITISNLSTPGRLRRTIAHEIGHKVINVSHEYKTTHPAQAVYADGGLMLYGDGEDIPAGAAGRWHLERLLMSPFLYRSTATGKKQWNQDYKEEGHYYDPIYGDKIVRFPGRMEMKEDW